MRSKRSLPLSARPPGQRLQPRMIRAAHRMPTSRRAARRHGAVARSAARPAATAFPQTFRRQATPDLPIRPIPRTPRKHQKPRMSLKPLLRQSPNQLPRPAGPFAVALCRHGAIALQKRPPSQIPTVQATLPRKTDRPAIRAATMTPAAEAGGADVRAERPSNRSQYACSSGTFMKLPDPRDARIRASSAGVGIRPERGGRRRIPGGQRHTRRFVDLHRSARYYPMHLTPLSLR